MDKLIIIGGGGHGKVVAEAAFDSKKFSDIAFLDDKYNLKEFSRSILNWKFLGVTEEMYSPKIKNNYKYAFVAIGDPNLRIDYIKKLKNLNYLLPIIKHPTSWVSRFSKIGEGTVILSNANLQTNSIIGIGSILNTGSIVEHDAIISDGVHICPGVSIAGNTRIGNNSLVGIGSSIKEGIKIGSNVTIGAGSVVISDIPDNVVAMGIPARW